MQCGCVAKGAQFQAGEWLELGACASERSWQSQRCVEREGADLAPPALNRSSIAAEAMPPTIATPSHPADGVPASEAPDARAASASTTTASTPSPEFVSYLVTQAVGERKLSLSLIHISEPTRPY